MRGQPMYLSPPRAPIPADVARRRHCRNRATWACWLVGATRGGEALRYMLPSRLQAHRGPSLLSLLTIEVMGIDVSCPDRRERVLIRPGGARRRYSASIRW